MCSKLISLNHNLFIDYRYKYFKGLLSSRWEKMVTCGIPAGQCAARHCLSHYYQRLEEFSENGSLGLAGFPVFELS